MTRSMPGYFNLVPGPLPVPHQPEDGELGMVVHQASLGYIVSYRLYKTLSKGRKQRNKNRGRKERKQTNQQGPQITEQILAQNLPAGPSHAQSLTPCKALLVALEKQVEASPPPHSCHLEVLQNLREPSSSTAPHLPALPTSGQRSSAGVVSVGGWHQRVCRLEVKF